MDKSYYQFCHLRELRERPRNHQYNHKYFWLFIISYIYIKRLLH